MQFNVCSQEYEKHSFNIYTTHMQKLTAFAEQKEKAC